MPTSSEMRSLRLTLCDEELNISTKKVIDFFRRRLEGRRLQLVIFILREIVESDGTVNVSSIHRRFNKDSDAFLKDLEMIHQFADDPNSNQSSQSNVTWDDVLDYYTDISCEVEDDNEFENYVMKSWNM